MQRVENSVGVAGRVSFPGVRTNSGDNSSRRALDFVCVSDMIPHKAFHPQVVFVVLEKEEGVVMDEEPDVDIALVGREVH